MLVGWVRVGVGVKNAVIIYSKNTNRKVQEGRRQERKEGWADDDDDQIDGRG